MLTFSHSFCQFLDENNKILKIAKILSKLLKGRNYIVSAAVTKKEVNYITFRNDGTLSFLPAGKEHIVSETNEWKKENRQNGKAGKIIRKVFTERALKLYGLKDTDFEQFVNSYKANFGGDNYVMSRLNRYAIKGVYDADRMDGGGNLNSSCMNGDSTYLDIYEKCNKLEILVLKDKNDMLAGRALLWQISDGTFLMDRIYVAKDFMYDIFLNFAEKNNFWRKVDYKSYAEKTFFVNPESKESEIKIFTINTQTDFGRYPYIDTFSYGSDGYLTNNIDDDKYTYSGTGGGRNEKDDMEEEDENYFYCEHCGGREHIDYGALVCADSARYDNCYVCENHTIEVHTNSRYPRSTETYFNNGNDDVVEVGNEYYTTESGLVTLCYETGEWELTEDVVWVQGIEEYYLADSNQICEIDGEYYLVDSNQICEIDGEYYLTDSNQICGIDGEYYLVDMPYISFFDGQYWVSSSNEYKNIKRETRRKKRMILGRN
jgi:hypothetical protein